MKYSLTIVALSASGALGFEASASVSTTVICSGCPTNTSSTPDIVTRSDVPTTPCSTPVFTIVSSSAVSSGNISSYSGTEIIPETNVASYPATEVVPETDVASYPATVAIPTTMIPSYPGTGAIPTTKVTPYQTGAVPTTKVPVVVSGADRMIAGFSGALALAAAVVYLA